VMRSSIRMGEGPNGLPIMKFTLTYDGELRSNGRPKHKWRIRNQISPQLNELWEMNPVLQHVERYRKVPKAKHLVGHYILDGRSPAVSPHNCYKKPVQNGQLLTFGASWCVEAFGAICMIERIRATDC